MDLNVAWGKTKQNVAFGKTCFGLIKFRNIYLQMNILEVLNSLCYAAFFFLLLNKLQKGVLAKLKNNASGYREYTFEMIYL